MDVFLELQTTHPEELRKAITGNQAAPDEADIKVTDELSLRFAGIEIQRSIDMATLVMFALTFPMGIATNVIADRISDFLRERGARDHIGKAFITIEEATASINVGGKSKATITTRREELSLD
jgi:hypothetical protein